MLGVLVTGSASAAPLSIDEQLALNRAATRGRLLYEYDQAAWISSDAIAQKFASAGGAPIAGWIVEPQPSALHVTYFSLQGASPQVEFTADVAGQTAVATHAYTHADAPALTPAERRLIAAREIATHQPRPGCVDAPFNTVVLPPPMPDGPIPVYLLTPQVKPGVYPFGGHFEVDVAANGTVAGSRPFSKTCLTLTAPPTHATAAFVTHVLDPTPTELHVYLSLWMGVPLIVETGPPRRRWGVDGDQIKALGAGR